MNDLFLTNYTDETFLSRLKQCFKRCVSFSLSVSFIKKAGLILFEREMEEALSRGVKGRVITSTYQNFTDIESLRTFNEWQRKYSNFECHLDHVCFGDNGYHSKGYLFEYDDSLEIIVGSTNITRFALKKNIEWNISLVSKDSIDSYNGAMNNFEFLWERTFDLNEDRIKQYSILLDYAIEKWDMDYVNPMSQRVVPNSMQRKALKELRRYRDTGVSRALIISATGSGKTYLAAFDARNFDPKRLLFVVHRETILKDARDSFMKIFGAEHTYGLYTGNKQDLGCDFIFASSNMLARHLDEFDAEEFDYICYDEVHHIMADSGRKIFEHFKPEFLLGLTATPERMDNKDVFDLFEQNVPFELRLRDAIINDLVVPFKYFGIRDELVDYGIDDRHKMSRIISEDKNVDLIASEINKHKLNNQKLKAVAFCVSVAHCSLMADLLAERGFKTLALTGANNTGERIKAFKDLQDESNELEIICTVDILNEGVDIPGINMVLFLRPTESSTIFLQQLGRGLRKYENKDYLQVLDFIGNNYKRSIQIGFALGTLGKTVYMDKPFIKQLIRDDFKDLGIPGVEIHIDELSKEEILNSLDNENLNTKKYLKKDYVNFKKYINKPTYPSHMDYIESEIAPDLNRFIKCNLDGTKVRSYYNFLKSIGEENVPLFSDEQNVFIDAVEDLLPLVRVDEYLIVNQLIKKNKLDVDELLGYNSKVNKVSLESALNNLVKKNIIEQEALTLEKNDEVVEYLDDLICYGLTRYEAEYGDFEGVYKLYSNYYKEQAILLNNLEYKMNIKAKGTYVDEESETAYLFVDLKKDKTKQERTNYKDLFLSPNVFQWESENRTTAESTIIKQLLSAKIVHLFVRKVKVEDNVLCPYTYFGTGTLTNMRESVVVNTITNAENKTLLFDVVLDNEVPVEYRADFEVPE